MSDISTIRDDSPHIEFQPGDIHWKWGFGDGDILRDFLDEESPGRERFHRHRHDGNDCFHWADRVLIRTIVEHVLPEGFPDGIPDLVFVHSAHNPVRSRAEWDGEGPYAEPAVSRVPVDLDAIRAIADEEKTNPTCPNLYPFSR